MDWLIGFFLRKKKYHDILEYNKKKVMFKYDR